MTAQPHMTPTPIIKYADDMAVIGQIVNNNESEKRYEINTLALWCKKTTLPSQRCQDDCGRGRRAFMLQNLIDGAAVERVGKFKFHRV